MREPAFPPSRCSRAGCVCGGMSSGCIPPVAVSCHGGSPWAGRGQGPRAVGEQQTHLPQLKYTQHQAGLIMPFMPSVNRNILFGVALEGGRREGGWCGTSCCPWGFICALTNSVAGPWPPPACGWVWRLPGAVAGEFMLGKMWFSC